MEYVYAALVLHESGSAIDEESISRVLGAAGMNINTQRSRALAGAIKDVDLEDVVEGDVGSYVYAALLLNEVGTAITKDNLSEVLMAAGISPQRDRVDALVKSLDTMDMDEAVASAAEEFEEPVPTSTEEPANKSNQSTQNEPDSTSDPSVKHKQPETYPEPLDGEMEVFSVRSRLTEQGPVFRYEVEHERVDHSVHLTTINPEGKLTGAIEDAFTQTLQGWRNGSSHPNVCMIHDWGTDPRPWVVIEPGEIRLAERVDDLTPQQAASVLSGVASTVRDIAFYNAHHQNLTLANVWVTEVDEGLTPIVDDWGLERRVYEAMGETHVTPYTAPEQLVSGTSATAKQTDIYGLGAVSYHVLTGEPPVRSDRDAITSGQIAPPSTTADLPSEVDSPVMQALESNPEDRQTSPSHFGRQLQGAV